MRVDLNDGTEFVRQPLTFAKFFHKSFICLRKMHCSIWQEIPNNTDYSPYLKNKKVYLLDNSDNNYELVSFSKILSDKSIYYVLLNGNYS